MIFFLLGVACVYSTMMGIASWLQPMGLYFQASDLIVLCTTSVLAPTLAAWGAAELLTLLRPRRLFDPRVRSRPHQFAAGLLTGVIGVCLAAIPLAMVDKDWHELLVLCGRACSDHRASSSRCAGFTPAPAFTAATTCAPSPVPGNQDRVRAPNADPPVGR